jgi:hypothetical protein
MTCPRCGLKISLSSPSRCPRCSQPLHPPFDQSARITKLAQSPETLSPPSLEDEEWPDLNDPPFSPVQRALSTTPPRSVFIPTDSFAVSTVIEMGRRMPPLKRTLLLAATAVVLLGLILGGTIFTVRALTEQGHPSGRPSAGNNPNTAGVTSTTARATAKTTATRAATATVVGPASTPTSPPQPVTIFSDPLTSNAKGWTSPDGCSFQSDGLNVNGSAQCVAPVTAADTVNISVQMKTVRTSTLGGAGIGFRISQDDSSERYTFFLNFNGDCVAEDQVTHTNFFDKSCPSAHQGQNAVNTLLINQSGAHMDFYVNGTFVGSANDSRLATGEVALEGTRGKQSVIFTNFTLTTLQ